jgi:uncharacterized protein YdeI (YjbR/CyaY-like superfamily)
MSPTKPASKTDLPVLFFEKPKDWATWLDENHASSPGVWLRLAKKNADRKSQSYAEALEVALCYGWIDGQKKTGDAATWLQKFTPRGARSIWSKINREKAEALVASGRMQAAGREEMEKAQRDGRWAAAYDGQKSSTVPSDLQVKLDRNPKAKAFFATLNSVNRYAILFRLQTAKKAETRERRLRQFVEMLEKGEKLHP